ncbi:MAG: phosphoribosylaminoimidazolesuccinocarboxamide synthase [Candidatus Cloacimonadaceae bacterium]|nr:phosphoribosylaminoimidazolesuccinocarboxamide synthase [Candidatus Cloacimonadaceae bacterium]MDP3113555.1 phosphoribosylaminoimidazolesuccinocarboxamide synthase [Candidatus Cloacimonadaceae bacterium]
MHDHISKLDIVRDNRQGKVRDIYDLGETMLIVTSDRISAFDVVFPDPVPDKGKMLNKIAAHFFKTTAHIVKNHFLSDQVADYPVDFLPFWDYLEGRSMLVKKTRVIPFECIVRGYISGSAWSEYKNTNTVGGMLLPDQMQESQKFIQPLFTPSTKAFGGHDENISYREMLSRLDEKLALFLKDSSLALYSYAHELMMHQNIVVADTKFEFGTIGGEVYLIDEALTPDSSRFWALVDYEIGKSPKSYDKQFVRDYLNQTGWDKQPPAPHLPEDIITKTREKYAQIYKIITGETI